MEFIIYQRRTKINNFKSSDEFKNLLKNKIFIKLYEDDEDILEDAIIENKQAIEMTNIYREILTSMTDAYASIISNNLNDVMKFLTSITIVLSIPTMVASFLGMNVPMGEIGTSSLSFIVILGVSFIVSILITIILKKKNML